MANLLQDTPLAGRRLIIFGGIAVAVVAATAAAVLFMREHKSSDEDGIRTVLAGMEDAWNRSDYRAYGDYLCAKSKANLGKQEFDWRRSTEGQAQFTVDVAAIDGDKASVYFKGLVPREIPAAPIR